MDKREKKNGTKLIRKETYIIKDRKSNLPLPRIKESQLNSLHTGIDKSPRKYTFSNVTSIRNISSSSIPQTSVGLEKIDGKFRSDRRMNFSCKKKNMHGGMIKPMPDESKTQRRLPLSNIQGLLSNTPKNKSSNGNVKQVFVPRKSPCKSINNLLCNMGFREKSKPMFRSIGTAKLCSNVNDCQDNRLESNPEKNEETRMSKDLNSKRVNNMKSSSATIGSSSKLTTRSTRKSRLPVPIKINRLSD